MMAAPGGWYCPGLAEPERVRLLLLGGAVPEACRSGGVAREEHLGPQQLMLPHGPLVAVNGTRRSFDAANALALEAERDDAAGDARHDETHEVTERNAEWEARSC